MSLRSYRTRVARVGVVLKEVKEGANVLSLLRKHKVTYEDIVHNPNILESKKRVFLSALALDLSRAKPVPVKKRT